MAQIDFTIADVLAWARTKPADEAYPYFDCHNCAMAQYSAHIGLPVFNPGRSEAENLSSLGEHLNAKPWTFGALAARLEKLLPADPVSATWTKADAYLSEIESVEA